jgi:hypothetical protein
MDTRRYADGQRQMRRLRSIETRSNPMKRFDTSPTVEPLAGVKWTTQYGYYRAKIAGWLDLSFSWESGTKGCARNGFRVFVGGAMLKARGSDPEDAARIAVAGAKSLLARASKELPTEPPTGA